ncbi:AAA family ATPase [Melaminivora jejuensis]|uniref:AAA family ATPase n=1 Tax=Melaminivora jejuensis TaxID=1267217 RepID=UPI001E337347|nr:ATP-binding protein [Melaminivora jejuensis]UHJ65371.1 AAA family ATPase [Melaminivora jejuensis]
MPRFRPGSKPHPLSEEQPDDLTRLWLLRIMQTLGGHKHWIRSHDFREDKLARALGLGHWLEEEANRPFNPKAVRWELRQLHAQAEAHADSVQSAPALRQNLAQLAALAHLSEVDCKILEFTCCLHCDSLLEEATDLFENLSIVQVIACVATILALPVDAVRSALAPGAVLARTGLLTLERNGRGWLRSRLDLLSEQLAEMMQVPASDVLHLLRDKVRAAPGAQLQLQDYRHIQPQLDIALPYLRQMQASGGRGVNIFIHGAPGTGKTELARTLAQALGCELFEVASEDSDGDPISAVRRLRAFRAAQSFFVNRRALMVFDEVEDVFNDCEGPLGGQSTAQSHKAWINRMLEDNPVPTLWLSNSGALDAAFIRRFDLVFELPVPPRRQRRGIVQRECAGLLDDAAIERMSAVETLAPAVVARAARVVRCVQDELREEPASQALERLVNNTLLAQGHRGLEQHGALRLPQVYDPAFIHADTDLAAVARGIARQRSARLCLYGPPGTGKTAYGHWLAQELDAPLLVRRASDLQSKWIGECEKNIARAFHEARQDGAVLLIDEVDSFLQDRRGAQRSWEVSQVNEMLTQMEAFDGVFIASTNLMQGLDQAALRRFDLKVKLDWLRPAQAWELLQRHCAQAGLAAPGPQEQARLAQLRQLAPGDFAAVLRQARFKPLPDAAALVAALEAECALKEGGRGVLGFV